MTISKEIMNHWQRIDEWLSATIPALYQALNPPANPVEIARVESIMGIAFPEELKASLSIHDGQNLFDFAVFAEWSPLASAEIAENWVMLEQLATEQAFETEDQPDFIQTDGPIRPRWWDRQWIPVACNPSGDLLCIDLNPPPEGRCGQIIRYRHDLPIRKLVAADLADWLKQIVGQMENGAFEINPGGTGLRRKK